MTTVFNNANGIASGTAVTVGNSGGTSGTAWTSLTTLGGGITAQATSAYEGTTGYAFAYSGTGGNCGVTWTGNGTTGSTQTARGTWTFVFKVSALPNAEDYLMSASSSGVTLGSDGKIRFRIAGGAAATPAVITPTAIAVNTWYFVQWALTPNTNNNARIEARVYRASDGFALLEADTGNAVTNTISSVTFATFGRGSANPSGSTGSTNAYTLSLDLIGQSSDYKSVNFPTGSAGVEKYQDFNTLTNGTTITTTTPATVAGSSTVEPETAFDYSNASTGATLQASSTAPYEGTVSARLDASAATSVGYVGWLNAPGNGQRGARSMAFLFESFGTSAIHLGGGDWTPSGQYIAVSTAGVISLANILDSNIATGPTLALNTWYVLQFAVTVGTSGNSNARIEVHVIRGSDGATIWAYDTGQTLAYSGGGSQTLIVGASSNSGGAGAVLRFDKIAVRTNLVGGFPGDLYINNYGATPLTGSGSLAATGSAISPLYANSTANTKTNTFEGLTDGTAITTANSGGTSGTAFSSVSAAGTGSSVTAVSTTGWDGAATIAAALTQGGTGSNAFVYWTSPGSLNGRLSASFFVKISALPPAGGKSMVFGFGTSAQLMIDSSGVAGMFISSPNTFSSLVTAAGAWLPNRWYFVQAAIKVGDASTATADDTLELRIYDTTTGAALIESIATTINFGPSRTTSPFYFGDSTAGTAYAYTTYLDNLAVSGDHPYPGAFPYLTNVTNVSPFDEYPEGGALISDFSQSKYGSYWVTNGNITASANSALEGGRGVRAAGANNIHAIAQNYNANASGNRVAASFYIRFNSADDFPTGSNTSFSWLALNGNPGITFGTGGNGSNLPGTLSVAGDGGVRLASSPAITLGVWYFSQAAVTAPNTTSATSRVEWRLWKQGGDGSWSKVVDYDSGPSLSFTNSGGNVIDWGNLTGGTTPNPPPDYDTVAWSQNQPFGFPGDALTAGPPPAFTGIATLSGSGALTAYQNQAKYNTFEGQTDGATVTTANSGGISGTAFDSVSIASGSTVTATSTDALVGVRGLRVVTPAQGATAFSAVNWFITAPAGVRISTSFYFKFTAIPGNNVAVAWFAGPLPLVILTSLGKIGVQFSGALIASSSASVSVNTWYLVQFAYTVGTTSNSNRVELTVVKQDTATTLVNYDSGASLSQTPATVTGVSFGRGTDFSAVAETFSYDQLGVDNTLTSGFPVTSVTLTTTATPGVNVALSAVASSNIPGPADLTGSGTLTATGVAPTITTAGVGVNVRPGADAQADFPTADFWHATFEGSDTAFSATVGSVSTDGVSAFDGLAGMTASGTSNAYVAWPATGTTDTSRKSASVYFKIDSLPSEVISILQHGSVASVAIKPDGTIGFNAPGIASPLGTFWSAATLRPDHWYSLQFAVTNSGSGSDRGELRVYDIAAETTIIEVDENGLDLGVSPAPSPWYFGRAGTTTNPISVAMDHLFATDMYRTWDFPGLDSAPITNMGFGHGSSYYQDFDSLSDGTAIVVANPGSGGTIPYAVPAANSPTSENEPSDFFDYNQGTNNGNTILATTDTPFQGTAALRMSLVPGGGGASTGWLTLSSFGMTWGTRSAAFSAFRIDSLPTYATGNTDADEFVALVTMVLGGVYVQPRTGRLAYENFDLGLLWEQDTAPTSPPLELGVWYVLRYATHLHIDGIGLRDRIEVRRGDTGDIIFFLDTGFYDHPAGNVFDNAFMVGVGGGHWDSPWSVTWDQLILRQDWQGAGYPGPLYPEFSLNETTADINVQVALDAFSPVDAVVDLGINLNLSATAESAGVVLEDTEFLPVPYGTVDGYIDGITIGGASSSFTMSTEFTQYASSDLNIPPVTSGSPIAAVDIAWQLAGNMRCNIPEGNYWSLQGHEAGFNLKTKEILKGRDESVYRLFDETFDKNGIPQGSVYRKWKVLDAYTSAGWYGWADDAIYSTSGRGASPAMRVGARTNIVCTARPGTAGILFSFGSDLGTPGFGPNNGEFGVGKWFTLQISSGDMLLRGQWRTPGAAAATDFSKTASLGPLGIGQSDSIQVLIGIEWVTATQMDVNVIVANPKGKVLLTQSMTGTGFDSYAAQWQHSGPIRALYQHSVSRAEMPLASFAGQSYETAVPFKSHLPSMGIDVTAPFVAFSGSIWDYLTQICIARQVDIRNDDGTILLTPMIDVTRQSYVWEPVITPSFALGMENVARKIEIVENIAEWRPLGTVYDSRRVESDTFSASPGQSVTFNVTVDSAASLIYTPAPVGGTSTDDPTADAVRDIEEFRDESKHIYGAYTVQGTLGDVQNHTVPAKEWIAYGGSVSVKPIDSVTVEVTVNAPNIPGYTGDFQLGLHGDKDYTLFRLVGDGLKLKTKTKTFQTGANPKWAPAEQASQITNVAATTPKIVNTLIARASTIADGPSITLTAAIAMAEVRAWGLSLGTIAGSTILYKNLQWRVLSATVKNSVVTIDARPYTTYKSDYWKINWEGRTWANFTSFWTGRRWDDFKVMPLSGPVADWGSRGPISKYTLFPAPDTTQETPPLLPTDTLVPSRDLLPSGGFMPENVPPTWPGYDLYPGGTDDPYATQ